MMSIFYSSLKDPIISVPSFTRTRNSYRGVRSSRSFNLEILSMLYNLRILSEQDDTFAATLSEYFNILDSGHVLDTIFNNMVVTSIVETYLPIILIDPNQINSLIFVPFSYVISYNVQPNGIQQVLTITFTGDNTEQVTIERVPIGRVGFGMSSIGGVKFVSKVDTQSISGSGYSMFNSAGIEFIVNGDTLDIPGLGSTTAIEVDGLTSLVQRVQKLIDRVNALEH